MVRQIPERPLIKDWENPLFCKGIPKGPPLGACHCKGCFMCMRQAIQNCGGDNPRARELGNRGYVTGCTCDLDWECVYGRHEGICFTYDR